MAFARSGLSALSAVVFGTFAALAILLAGVGLYDVFSQLIAQRTQTFSLRVALGAQKRDILALVIRQDMLSTLAGLAAGIVVILVLARRACKVDPMMALGYE